MPPGASPLVAEFTPPEGWPHPTPPAGSLPELLEQLHGMRRAGWLFRGESRYNPTRKAALARKIPHSDPGISAYSNNEADLINLFRSIAWPHLQQPDLTFTTGVFGWLVLMQHHGAPTRLLDWSWSHWVAAYHATSQNPEEDGFIWAFDAKALSGACTNGERDAGRRLMRAEKLKDWIAATLEAPTFVVSCGTVEATARMVAQQGTFTLSSPPWADHSVELGKRLPATSLQLLRIQAALKPQLSQVLTEMNLTAASLYPGIDGVGRRVAEAMDWGHTIPHSD